MGISMAYIKGCKINVSECSGDLEKYHHTQEFSFTSHHGNLNIDTLGQIRTRDLSVFLGGNLVLNLDSTFNHV